MTKKKNYIFRLGLFVTVSIILFIIATYYIGNNQNLFKPTFSVSSVFSNVNGLQQGNNVRYAGIRVGVVDDIVILDDSTLRVDMVLEEKVRTLIKKDAVTSIGSDGLVGSMIVNINPGPGQAPHVEDGDVLLSYSRLKTEDILNTLGKTNENLALLSNDLLTITGRITRGKGTIAMLLRDSVMADELRQSISNLRATTAYLNATSRQLNGLIREVESGDGLLATLIRDTTIKHKVDDVLVHIEGDMLEKVDSILLGLQRSGRNIEAFSTALGDFSRDLNDDKGLVNAALRDTTVANDLKDLLQNLHTGSAMLNENLQAMRENFLFRKYFKDLEKEEEKRKK